MSLNVFIFYFVSSVGKKQLFWFFQRWLCVSAKTKCAVCAVGFSCMPHNVLRYETLRISEHKPIKPQDCLLIVISLKFSTIRAMFYDRLLWPVINQKYIFSLLSKFSINRYNLSPKISFCNCFDLSSNS